MFLEYNLSLKKMKVGSTQCGNYGIFFPLWKNFVKTSNVHKLLFGSKSVDFTEYLWNYGVSKFCCEVQCMYVENQGFSCHKDFMSNHFHKYKSSRNYHLTVKNFEICKFQPWKALKFVLWKFFWSLMIHWNWFHVKIWVTKNS